MANVFAFAETRQGELRRAALEAVTAARAVLDDGAIGVACPAEPGRHHVAMGIERDHRPRAEAVTDDQVGDAGHAGGRDRRGGHRMGLDRKAEPLEQRAGARRMRGAVARRVVGRDSHQLGQEGLRAGEVLVDEWGDR